MVGVIPQSTVNVRRSFSTKRLSKTTPESVSYRPNSTSNFAILAMLGLFYLDLIHSIYVLFVKQLVKIQEKKLSRLRSDFTKSSYIDPDELSNASLVQDENNLFAK